MAIEKKWFPFSSDKPFTDIMTDHEICREVVERCIGRKIDKVENVSPQRPIIPDPESHGVRCDVFMKDSKGVRYDVEMQTCHFGDLPMRYRGYQSAIDASFWLPGQDYSDLGHTYIIFLCTGNPFRVPKAERRSRYEVASMVRGTSLPPLETHAHWLALDASAWALEGDPALRNLLRYVKEEVVAEGDGLLRRIDDEVSRLNRDPEWRKAVITYEQKYGKYIREEGKAEGLAEGRAEGLAEGEAKAFADALRLMQGLKAIGRQDDLERALGDEDFRRKVMAEIGLKS